MIPLEDFTDEDGDEDEDGEDKDEDVGQPDREAAISSMVAKLK